MFKEVRAAPANRIKVEAHSKKNSILFEVNIDITHL
jgi:hypothetical protein